MSISSSCVFRSRRHSQIDHKAVADVGLGGRRRHMSMQDRVEMYNTVLALEDEANKEAGEATGRQRKSSKVMFEHPKIEMTDEGARVVDLVQAEVHQVFFKYFL